jgi:hypothetical protein
MVRPCQPTTDRSRENLSRTGPPAQRPEKRNRAASLRHCYAFRRSSVLIWIDCPNLQLPRRRDVLHKSSYAHILATPSTASLHSKVSRRRSPRPTCKKSFRLSGILISASGCAGFIPGPCGENVTKGRSVIGIEEEHRQKVHALPNMDSAMRLADSTIGRRLTCGKMLSFNASMSPFALTSSCNSGGIFGSEPAASIGSKPVMVMPFDNEDAAVRL